MGKLNLLAQLARGEGAASVLTDTGVEIDMWEIPWRLRTPIATTRQSVYGTAPKFRGQVTDPWATSTTGNHTAYKQTKGTKATAEEIREIYEGLKLNYLNDFDMLLSGYIPGAEAVAAVGQIARDLKLKSSTKPGSFFWGVSSTLSVIGSTIRNSSPHPTARIFKIDIPAIDCFFSGTGDMFAALIIARFREAIANTDDGDLLATKSWVSPDDVEPAELPLAKATEKALASMQAVLDKTKVARDQELESLGGDLGVLDKESSSEKRLHLRRTKAAEVRLVANVAELKEPDVRFFAESLES
ncbi:MAG: putative endonuclease lcl3 [Chaenotheca gracillima]|nr:MAG: putative endonuclease lcl3 [Chaenotheca gracillima]